VMEVTNSTYGSDLRSRDMKAIQKQLEQKSDQIVTQEFASFSIEKAKIEAERKDALSALSQTGKTEAEINNHYNNEIQKKTAEFKEKIATAIEEAVPAMCEEVIKDVETKKRERTKETIEDAVRDHLRGFARTIPSFLMAYGDENTTLDNFDEIIPDEVFIEVTSISLDQFRLLRDGGTYIDSETQEEKTYPGRLFDPVVFDDSVKEFLSLKERLSDYFDDEQTEDIFDYIPPQKTNQIFTPKETVIRMVNLLEEENPGCFDDPNKTFIDMYMKSGLYITEIVKRLYNSQKMQELYPNKSERLKHIFEKQVYGLAPTEIIYKIATNFILGFDADNGEIQHNFRMADALPYAKEGTLNELIDELYGEM